MKASNRKDEALTLIGKAGAVADMLPEGFERRAIKMALMLAIDAVSAIEELKRPRRAKAPQAADP